MNIKRLTVKEKLAAKKLWRDVFVEDTAAFIDFYFAEEFDRDVYLGMFDRENLVSMVGLTNANIRLNGMDKNTFLFRGVATDKAYTGKGYASKLMLHAMEYLKSQKIPFVLLKTFIHPFYEKLGFTTCSYTQDEKVEPQKVKKDIAWQAITNTKNMDNLLSEKLYQLYIDFIADKNLFITRTKEVFYRRLHEAIDISKEQLIVLFENDIPIAYSLCEARPDIFYGEETVFSSKEQLSFFVQIAVNVEKKEFVYKNVMGAQTADAMCRVLNVEEMLKELVLTKTTYIRVEDKLFADNDGIWKISVIEGKKSVSKIEKADDSVERIALSISVGELGAYLIGEEAPENMTNYFNATHLHGIFEQY